MNRSRLPEPGPPRPPILPSIEKSTTASGLRVWTVRHPAVPVVTAMLLVRRGAADDPLGKEGLAALAVDMFDEGSGGRSAISYHEALARLGTQLESEIASDAALLGVTVLSRFVGEALGLLADALARPSLTEDDFVRVRQLRLHWLVQLRDMPAAVADRAFVRLLYGDHPYGHTPLGTERSLAALTLDDVREFHRSAVKPSESTLIVVGDCEHEEITRLAARAFAEWEGTAAPNVRAVALPADPPRLNLVPRSGAPQSELRIGQVAAARGTPDYHALVTANMVLGGQFVSRINLNLREDKGFTYGARTAFDFRRLPGPFVLQVGVHTAATARAIEESLAEIAAIRGSRPVTPEELALAVAALTRGYARNFETAGQIARAMSQIALHDLPDDYFARFPAEIESVTVDDVTRVTREYLDPSRLTTLIVGDADAVRAELDELRLGDAAAVPADAF